EAVGTQFLKLGEFLALHPEALVVRQMPMKHVHLHRFHTIEVALDDVERDEVAANINHQTAPDETWSVMDAYDRNGKNRGRGFDQLQEGLQSMQRSQRVGRR